MGGILLMDGIDKKRIPIVENDFYSNTRIGFQKS